MPPLHLISITHFTVYEAAVKEAQGMKQEGTHYKMFPGRKEEEVDEEED